MNVQEKELWWLSVPLVENQVIFKSLPEKPHQEIAHAPAMTIDKIRQEVINYLLGTVNINREAVSRIGHPQLIRLTTIKRDTFEDILTDAGLW